MSKSIRNLLLVFLIITVIVPMTSFTEGGTNTLTNRDNTPGTVTFTATTKPAGGNFAPRHVLAIWVEHNGEFVKTRKAMANQRKQYLYKWKASSNYNVVDAITGPTLTYHQTHTVTWDCTDLDENVVPDGEYTMIIEFTDKHAQGPYYEVEFTKGTEPVVINPPDQTYIVNMQLTYEPETTASADFSANLTEVCTGQQITFTDNSTGAVSWSWDFGDGANPSTANTAGPHTVVYQTSGSKTVSLTINDTIVQTKTDYITVYPNPVAGFVYVQNSFVVDFTNISINAVSYLWDFGDGESSTEENPTHVYAQDGSYEVSLTATSDMCGSDIYSETVVINTVGIPETSARKKLSVFPNPSDGEVFLLLEQKMQNVSVRIFDPHGRMISQKHYDALDAGTIKLPGSGSLASGLYFLELSGNRHHYREKILIR